MRSACLAPALALTAAAAWAQPAPEATAFHGPEQAPTTLTTLGTTDVALFAPLLEAFVATVPEVAVHYVQRGSNDPYAVAAAACRGNAPPADLPAASLGPDRGAAGGRELARRDLRRDRGAGGHRGLRPLRRRRDLLLG